MKGLITRLKHCFIRNFQRFSAPNSSLTFKVKVELLVSHYRLKFTVINKFENFM